MVWLSTKSQGQRSKSTRETSLGGRVAAERVSRDRREQGDRLEQQRQQGRRSGSARKEGELVNRDSKAARTAPIEGNGRTAISPGPPARVVCPLPLATGSAA